MAEELAFHQGFGDAAAVDRDERLIPALAFLVDRPGDQFFSRTAFARDEHIGLGPGNLSDQAVDVLHGRAAADDHS